MQNFVTYFIKNIFRAYKFSSYFVIFSRELYTKLLTLFSQKASHRKIQRYGNLLMIKSFFIYVRIAEEFAKVCCAKRIFPYPLRHLIMITLPVRFDDVQLLTVVLQESFCSTIISYYFLIGFLCIFLNNSIVLFNFLYNEYNQNRFKRFYIITITTFCFQ